MFVSTRLARSHEVEAFTCGKTALDDWLKSSAVRAQEAGTARTYVWTDGDAERVWAYYAIAPTEIVRADDGLSRKLAAGYSRIPGYLIARLAVDQSLQGRGLGEQLLIDAISRVVAATETGGGRLIVVDALDDDAAQFYLGYGFVAVRNREHRLVMTVATAKAAFGDEQALPRSTPGS